MHHCLRWARLDSRKPRVRFEPGPGVLGDSDLDDIAFQIEYCMTRNSKADAARLLGMPRTTLINRMQRLGIQSD